MDLNILQHYWWILICILGGLLVFLLFVQGGQSLLYTIGKNKDERDLIVIPWDINGNIRLPH